MQIYFTASLSGKPEYEKNYQEIIGVLEKLGHKIISRHVVDTKFEDVVDSSDKQLVKYYEKTLQNISKCDLVVSEVSHPTIGIGHEISIALDKGKPVIVLVEEKALMPQILKVVPSANIRAVKYTLGNLENVIKKLITEVKSSIPVRFNFFVSPEINEYLDWIARVKRTPRAVYLRELLEKEMEKSKEFGK